MQPIDYFKRQAKNLLQDLKTRKLDTETGRFVYVPRFFDIESLILNLLIRRSEREEAPTLMRAQHIIARILDFESWDDLIHAPEDQLEFCKLLFENQDKIDFEEWASHEYLVNLDRIMAGNSSESLSYTERKALLQKYLDEHAGRWDGHPCGYFLPEEGSEQELRSAVRKSRSC